MKAPAFTMFAAVAWLTVTLSGTWLMIAYSNAPGAAGEVSAEWPRTSGVPHSANRPTVLMFVHPHCPCSRASVGELALLMAHGGDRADVRVIFLDPAGMEADWVKTDLWIAAAAIPGVTVMSDSAGRVARTFGAVTSGDTRFYDGSGRLLFHGGITAARGHSGDNVGRTAIEELLRGTPGEVATPVFGCALFGKEEGAAPCQ